MRRPSKASQVRNLTCLFVVIGIALVNALANAGSTMVVLLPTNIVLAGTVGVLEMASFSARESSERVGETSSSTY